MFCRLIVDAAHSGAWNMAVDEVLLESAGTEQTAYLRFYRWNEPTLSLGYFQHYEDRLQHPASANCAVVRRLSGGGAILHDQEWTYSLALPLQSPLGKNATVTYDLVNQATLATLAQFGVTAGTYNDSPVEPALFEPAGEPFLCFQRRSSGDLVFGPEKIMGSAQRRRHGAILQHGSLLLRRSLFAPELPGAADLQPGIDDTQLLDVWRHEMCHVLGLKPVGYTLSDSQFDSVEPLVRDKFGSASWTCRR